MYVSQYVLSFVTYVSMYVSEALFYVERINR